MHVRALALPVTLLAFFGGAFFTAPFSRPLLWITLAVLLTELLLLAVFGGLEIRVAEAPGGRAGRGSELRARRR